MNVVSAPPGWVCPVCGAGVAPGVATHCEPARSFADRVRPGTVKFPPTPQFDRSTCPCNPERGGSGICGCIMGGPTITCVVA